MEVDPTADRPVFRQIADVLRAGIADGSLPPGARLPSEAQLTARYGAARETVRRAIGLLKAEGLITTAHGRGAFVRPPAPLGRLPADRFTRHRLLAEPSTEPDEGPTGGRQQVHLLAAGKTKADRTLAALLGVRAGTALAWRTVRYHDETGQPLEQATSHYPANLLPPRTDPTKLTGPQLYAALEANGHRLTSISEEITARMPTPTETRDLRLPDGVPVLAILRTIGDQHHQIIEACHTLLAADRFTLTYQLPIE